MIIAGLRSVFLSDEKLRNRWLNDSESTLFSRNNIYKPQTPEGAVIQSRIVGVLLIAAGVYFLIQDGVI